MNYLAQGLGVVALVVAVISFQQKTQKRIVFLQMISSAIFAVHFYMLGAYVGSILNAVGIFRAIVFSNRDKSWANNKVWLYVFVLIFIASGILTWDNMISILPVIGIILSTVAFWVINPTLVRLLSLPSSVCWFIYNLISNSYAGMTTEVFIFSSILIAIYIYDIKAFKKRELEM